MASRKDLAGLAALGALGYMLRDKDTPYQGVVPASALGSQSFSTPERVDAGELRDETGALSTLRRNTETGDLYSPTTSITRPAVIRPTRPSAGPVVRSRELGSQQFPMTRGPNLPTTSRTSTRPMTRDEAIAELNRATGTGSMDVNADRGPNAITDTQLSRNI